MTITNITVAQLRVLTAIAETGSFSAAAASIGMTQSGVSQAIKCLEDALGLQLLARGRNGALPNEIGRKHGHGPSGSARAFEPSPTTARRCRRTAG